MGREATDASKNEGGMTEEAKTIRQRDKLKLHGDPRERSASSAVVDWGGAADRESRDGDGAQVRGVD